MPHKQEFERSIIKHIVLALDATPHSTSSITRAVDIASQLMAELTVVCVEDKNLLQLASSPFAKTISSFSDGAKPLDKEAIQRMVRLQVQGAKEALALAVGDKPVKNSLVVRRGVVEKEVVEASKDADMLLIGCSSGWGSPDTPKRSLVNRPAIGQRSRYILRNADTNVLVLRSNVGIETPVFVPFDGNDTSLKTLNAVADIVSQVSGEEQIMEGITSGKTKIAVLLIAENPEKAMMLRNKASEILVRHNTIADYMALPKMDEQEAMTRTILRAVNKQKNCIIAVGKEETIMGECVPCDFPQQMINEMYGSILQIK